MTRPPIEDLLERNLPNLRAFVRLRVDPLLRARESCSDLVQSVCGEVLQYAGTIEYRGENEFRHMLYVSVLNKIRKRRRYYLAEKRSPNREADDMEEELAAAYREVCSPSQHAAHRETIELLERAFDRLSEPHREVLTLAKLCGLSHKEMAEKLDRTVPAVRNMLHRAMVELAEAMVEARAGE